jgi:predicted nucleotide-binding protein
MADFIEKSKSDIAYMRIDELLEYYKACVILNEKSNYNLESSIDIIEDEIRDRL